VTEEKIIYNIYQLKERVLHALVETMLDSIKERGGIYLSEDERIKLYDKLMEALDGSVRI
jgi:hypothetical protein